MKSNSDNTTWDAVFDKTNGTTTLEIPDSVHSWLNRADQQADRAFTSCCKIVWLKPDEPAAKVQSTHEDVKIA